MKIIRYLLPVLVIAVGIGIAMLIFANKPVAERKSRKNRPLAVEVLNMHVQDYRVTIKAQGLVAPRTLTTLTPRVEGEIMHVSSHFRPGGFFNKGDILLKIDATDYQLALKSAEADVAEARFVLHEEQAQAAQAKANWQQLRPSETPSDLVLRKPQLARAQARVDAAQAALQKAQLDLKRTRIKAPYPGRILEQYVDIGQFVGSGEPLVKVFATRFVEIRLPISEKQRAMLDLPFKYQNQETAAEKFPEAKVTAEINGKRYQWPGRVVRSEASLDEATRQTFIVVQVKNPYQRNAQQRPPLDIGQYVDVAITGRLLNNVLRIPRSALQAENSVMTVTDNILQRQEVAIVWSEDDFVLVNKGLSATQQLVANYIPYAADNVRVKVVPVTASKQ